MVFRGAMIPLKTKRWFAAIESLMKYLVAKEEIFGVVTDEFCELCQFIEEDKKC